MSRRHAVALAAALALLALLTGLGLWQLQRLAWKEAILARIAERARAAAAELPPPAQWPALTPDDYEYRHVRLRGRFEHDKESLVFRASGDGKAGAAGPGFLVLTPLRLADGSYVIVNRGFVPLALNDPAGRAAGQAGDVAELTGLMRPPEPRNAFTPADRPALGEWYTRDPLAMAAHWRLSPAAPFSVDADAAAAPGWPQGGATVLTPRNDHLAYALTWFGLALGVAGACAAYALTLRRKTLALPE